MQIIIPMSGFGTRFVQAGYSLPKPLIDVDGRPIISYVIDMFPGETDFTFICNQEHLDNPAFKMRETLLHYCPTARIVTCTSSRLGPVNSVIVAQEWIKDDEPVIVNYCDFTCDWNYQHFCQWLDRVKPEGCIPAYQGFHPHSLGSTFYAYIKEKDLIASDIQEKQPFTTEPMQEFASSGTYYFAKGSYIKKYFPALVTRGIKVNDEYYVSMVYKLLFEDHLSVAVYKLAHFMQWGVPDDLQEYLWWSSAFAHLIQHPKKLSSYEGALLMPMVGLGNRFAKEGYHLPKPCIPVSGKPMFIQALTSLPTCEKNIFILRDTLPHKEKIIDDIEKNNENNIIISLPEMTEGQAITCYQAKNSVDLKAPLIISACDNAILYNQGDYQALFDNPDIDVIVWGVSGYPYAIKSPQMYGWIELDSEQPGMIKSVSVKKALKDLKHDPVIVGTFTFKRAADFFTAVDSLLQENDRVNNEFYVDSCINHAIKAGLRCAVFNVDFYLSWGTPNELKIFEYWQSAFHFWHSHPYKLSQDPFVPAARLATLASRLQPVDSPLPVINPEKELIL